MQRRLTSHIGYDGSLMGSINALSNYQKYYNLPENGASSTGIVFAIFNVGKGGTITALSAANSLTGRPNDGMLLYLGCGLAWTTFANLYRLRWSDHRQYCHCHGKKS